MTNQLEKHLSNIAESLTGIHRELKRLNDTNTKQKQSKNKQIQSRCCLRTFYKLLLIASDGFLLCPNRADWLKKLQVYRPNHAQDIKRRKSKKLRCK